MLIPSLNMLNWISFFSVSILDGIHYSDRYFLQQFCAGLPPSLSFLGDHIHNTMSTWMGGTRIHKPVPTFFDLLILLLPFMLLPSIRIARIILFSVLAPFKKLATPPRLMLFNKPISIAKLIKPNFMLSRVTLTVFLMLHPRTLPTSPLLLMAP